MVLDHASWWVSWVSCDYPARLSSYTIMKLRHCPHWSRFSPGEDLFDDFSFALWEMCHILLLGAQTYLEMFTCLNRQIQFSMTKVLICWPVSLGCKRKNHEFSSLLLQTDTSGLEADNHFSETRDAIIYSQPLSHTCVFRKEADRGSIHFTVSL